MKNDRLSVDDEGLDLLSCSRCDRRLKQREPENGGLWTETGAFENLYIILDKVVSTRSLQACMRNENRLRVGEYIWLFKASWSGRQYFPAGVVK